MLEQQMERGGVNCPLFQELQTPDEPTGSQSGESFDEDV